MKKILALFLGVLMVSAVTTTAFAATFTDVPDDHPYKNAIEFCAQKGFISGITENTVAPDATLTRAQFATMWCKAQSLDNSNHTFSDISPLRNYYDSSVITLRSLGILQGTGETQFSVNSNITREQLALIAKQTHQLGVADPDDYKSYTDHEDVSEWARDGVSAAINAKIFRELYDGETLQPQKSVTRGELCQLLYNINMPAHAITVDTLTGGQIVPSASFARAGQEITLTITPDANMRLKEDTLKYNDEDITGTSFIMPAEDVLITGEFEAAPVVLSSISVSTDPNTVEYSSGQDLDLSGIVITAHYSDGSSDVVTSYTTDPAQSATLEVVDDQTTTITVTVTYTEDEITRTTTFDVTVNPT